MFFILIITINVLLLLEMAGCIMNLPTIFPTSVFYIVNFNKSTLINLNFKNNYRRRLLVLNEENVITFFISSTYSIIFTI